MTAPPEVGAHIPIDRSANIALHEQVYAGFRRAILRGLLRPGQRVPSTRALAEELGMSRLPVLTAYEQLTHEGYFEARAGSGTYVSTVAPESLLEANPGAVRACKSFWRHGPARERVPAGRDKGGVRPFRASLPALDAFPHAQWARLLARRAHAFTPSQLSYGDPAGIGSMRAAIASHLRSTRAVNCDAEYVMVTPGSQAALRIGAAALLNRGDRVAMEEPGYPGARAAFRAAGAEIVPIPVDSEGFDVSALASLRQAVRAVYVTPSHQYPLGMSMTVSRRATLLSWAARNDAWIFEDDYDSEYRYVSPPIGALQGMDSRSRVVYLGSFSRVLYPALRTGYLVVPPACWEAFLDAREAFDICSPSVSQLVLAEFMKQGLFARHVRRMRGVYQGRREALLEGLARHCGGLLTVLNAEAGLHCTTLLAEGLDDTEAVRHMCANGLTATRLSECYTGRIRRQGLLLGFGGFDAPTLFAATRVLADALRTLRCSERVEARA